MLVRGLRRLTARAAACVAALALAACGRADRSPAARYLGDAAYRRAALVASLASRGNDYARLRLAHYDSGDARDWSRLAAWNPRVVPATLDGAPPAPAPAALDVAAASRGDAAALRALGQRAFVRYPVQMAPQAARAVHARRDAEAYGLRVDDDGSVGGLVRAQLADGTTGLAMTCSTCHAARGDDGVLRAGVPDARLDLGRLAVDAAGARAAGDPEHTRRLRAWGPGRVDVSTDDASAPTSIPDLRPTRWLTHLHHDATVVQSDVVALAIRIETLVVTSHHGVLRPPREVALGLAVYLWSLGDALPEPVATSAAARRGEAQFEARCAACHAPPGFTGPPVALGVVGTDPAEGRSPERGTGCYRVPSLRGVATRGPLLHDGAAPTLGVLFDPSRLRQDFAGGARPGAIAGHAYGLDLDDDARADLLAWLATL